MSELHIFRGLPGSGKTTAARKLAAETGAILIEPDSLLVRNGEYKWSPERFKSAEVCAHALVNIASCMNCDIIYTDVLPKLRDIWEVKRQADIYPYKLVVHDLKITVEESMKRNTHNVRREDIKRMAREWEDYKE